MPRPDLLEIGFDNQTYSKAKVRKFVADAVSRLAKFDQKMRDRIFSVVDELCNNALEHGSAEGDEVKLKTRVSPDQVEIIVEDRGTGKSPKTAQEIRKIMKDNSQLDPRKNHAKRGRGLASIVSSWMDEVEFADLSDGGIRTRVIKYL